MFALKYKEDPGLEFLQFCNHEQIKSLVEILIETGGSSEELSSNEEFIKNKENLTACWKLIAAELQRFGGNTISNLARIGEGVVYSEILGDISFTLDIEKEDNSIPEKEDLILMKILSETSTEKKATKIFKEHLRYSKPGTVSPSAFKDCLRLDARMAYESCLDLLMELREFANECESKERTARPTYYPYPSGDIWTKIAYASAGYLFNSVINKADPAYRVTIPAVIQVAYLRRVVMSKNIL